MAFDVHPVTKERWPDLVELFDRPIVRTCFCMFYRKTGTGTGVGLENRRAMKALVDRGAVPGLIGYENGVPVAWVSLGPREDYAKLRRSPVMKPVDDRPVWSIVCFFVDRGARGRGLSERMLRAAVDYARSCGARLVEAYPVDKGERSHPDSMFFGAKSMYDRAGSGKWSGEGRRGRWCGKGFGPGNLLRDGESQDHKKAAGEVALPARLVRRSALRTDGLTAGTSGRRTDEFQHPHRSHGRR